MSGGSYNYLFGTDEWDDDDLEAMARRLDLLGLPDAAAQTRALIAPRLPHPDPLRDLWHAVEWRDSGDTGDEALRAAVHVWRLGGRDRG